MELTNLQLEFLDYMTSPDHGTQVEFARSHGVTEETLRRWKKTEWWQDAVEERMRELYLSPERVVEVLRAVHENAVKGDIQAQKLYMQYLDRLNPIRAAVEDRSVTEMSDAELEDAWLAAGGRAE